RRALWAGPGEDEPADRPRAQERELLCDEAAEREAEQVDLPEAQGVEEGQHRLSRLGDRVLRRAGRGADAGGVDEDDLALVRERVGECRVPVVEVAAEVLQEHEWHRARAAEPAVRVCPPGGLDELRRRRLM